MSAYFGTNNAPYGACADESASNARALGTENGEFSMALGQTYSTALVQIAQSNQSRPWDRHLLLYYPGTDGSVHKADPWDRHSLLYYLGTDGSVHKVDPGTDIYYFT